MSDSRTVDPLSCVSISVEPFIQHPGHAEVSCGNATAFVVERGGSYFLVTNYHVIAGRKATDNAPISNGGGLPTHLRCHCHSQTLGTWAPQVVPLYDGHGDPSSDKPKWISTQLLGSSAFQFADLAILPLPKVDRIRWYPVAMQEGDQIATTPCSRAAVIGFPGAKTSFKFFPIWVTGYVASEPQLDYDNAPIILVNATTTRGMSGSPVFQIEDGNYQDTSGNAHYDVGRFSKFLGVYSGRITEARLTQLVADAVPENDSPSKSCPLNIGLVWKASAISSLLDSALSRPLLK